jgi:valyl-tRNA synthetase
MQDYNFLTSDKGNKIFVAEDESTILAEARDYYQDYLSRDGGDVYFCNTWNDAVYKWGHNNQNVYLVRDSDVLDTWFSSALWPFGTLGWPDETPELKRYYPTNVLVTGFDIIFFWVARMMMDGLHFMGKAPFKTVYVHALVRDEQGQKMSKSKGNVIDPLEFADKYGADALRFTLAALESQGRDIKLSEKRVEGYRNFATKLWNVSRFCEMNFCLDAGGFNPASPALTVNQWIVAETARAAADVTSALEAFRFNDAAGAIYQFVWGTFCDWHVELIKPLLMGEDEAEKLEARKTAAWVLDQILVLLHPFMPFVTEELWHALSGNRTSDLILGQWPSKLESLSNPEASAEMDWVIRVISEIRTARAEMNVPAGAKIPLEVQGANAETLARLEKHDGVLCRLARLTAITVTSGAPPKGAVQTVVDEATLFLNISGVIDITQEQARLEKTLEKLEKEVASIEGRLANEKFVTNAPDAVIAENRDRLAEAAVTAAKLNAALKRLSAAG